MGPLLQWREPCHIYSFGLGSTIDGVEGKREEKRKELLDWELRSWSRCLWCDLVIPDCSRKRRTLRARRHQILTFLARRRHLKLMKYFASYHIVHTFTCTIVLTYNIIILYYQHEQILVQTKATAQVVQQQQQEATTLVEYEVSTSINSHRHRHDKETNSYPVLNTPSQSPRSVFVVRRKEAAPQHVPRSTPKQ